MSVAEFQAGIKKAAGPAKTGGKKCGKCGQPGYNAKTCGRSEGGMPEQSKMLTEGEYDQVKALQEEEISSKQVAEDLDLPHEQVNFAFAAPEYSLYVHHISARQKAAKN